MTLATTRSPPVLRHEALDAAQMLVRLACPHPLQLPYVDSHCLTAPTFVRMARPNNFRAERYWS